MVLMGKGAHGGCRRIAVVEKYAALRGSRAVLREDALALDLRRSLLTLASGKVCADILLNWC